MTLKELLENFLGQAKPKAPTYDEQTGWDSAKGEPMKSPWTKVPIYGVNQKHIDQVIVESKKNRGGK